MSETDSNSGRIGVATERYDLAATAAREDADFERRDGAREFLEHFKRRCDVEYMRLAACNGRVAQVVLHRNEFRALADAIAAHLASTPPTPSGGTHAG